MYVILHVKYPLFLSDRTESWIFPTDFGEVFKYQISWKSAQWEPSCSMRTDGQVNVFHNDTNAPEKDFFFCLSSGISERFLSCPEGTERTQR